MIVSLVQLSAGTDVAANLELVAREVERARDDGARLVVFPEATMRRFGGKIRDIAEPLDGPWADGVRRIADAAGVTVVVGMFTPSDDGRVRNTVLVTGGGVEASYDKIHLFDAFGFAESETVAPGSEPVVVDVDGVGVGIATCYDLRFPGLFTRLARDGAEVIVVPASWGDGPGKLAQWRLLVRARALDSTTFVLATDQADPTAAGRTVPARAPLGIGHSMVATPRGEVIAELDAAAGMLTVDIDPAETETVRAEIPVLVNQRF